MLIIDNKVVGRNLQEQVLDNKQRIAEHYEIDRVLTHLDIRVIGTVDTYQDIQEQTPPPDGYQYGDAFAVGLEPPYDFYVYTRGPIDGSTEGKPYWMNIGQLAIVGPQGPAGESIVGPQGETTKWYVAASPLTGSFLEGEMLLTNGTNNTGNVYRYENNNWVLKSNIRGQTGLTGNQGPQGVKGEQGEQGEQGIQGIPGTGPRIIGELTSVDQLPSPQEQTRDDAYLINGELYMVVGDDSLQWQNFGTFPVVEATGTRVTVNGVSQTTWEANTKLDKPKNTSSYTVYIGLRPKTNEVILNPATTSPINTVSLASRKSNGCLEVNAPQIDKDACNKAYVDSKVENIVQYGQTSYLHPVIYVDEANLEGMGTRFLGYIANGIPTYNSIKELKGTVNDGSTGDTLINKDYLDDKLASSSSTPFMEKVFYHQFTYPSSDTTIPASTFTDGQYLFVIDISDGLQYNESNDFSLGAPFAAFQFDSAQYNAKTLRMLLLTVSGGNYKMEYFSYNNIDPVTATAQDLTIYGANSTLNIWKVR